MGRRLDAARIKTIYQRQLSPTWDESYQPSVLATPQEAPSSSNPSIICYEKFGREIHLLSNSELALCIFALYHPNTVGIQEQRLLSPVPTVNPLWTFPGVDKLSLPPLKGTINVAERLGLERYIPKIKIKNKAGEFVWVTIPYLGDLLVAQNYEEKIICINWTIKGQQKDFSEIQMYQFDKINRTAKAQDKLLARHQIEQIYYVDGEIRTVCIGGDEINRNVLHNLRQLFLYHRRCQHLLAEQRAELLHYFLTAFQAGTPPFDVIRHFEMRGKYTPEQSKSVLFQSIWHRKIRPDLFQPLLIDRPLNPEKHDVLDVYADFFRTTI